MRASVGFLLACVAVASLVAITSGQTYTLEPSGTVVDWHVATEWEYLSMFFFFFCRRCQGARFSVL